MRKCKKEFKKEYELSDYLSKVIEKSDFQNFRTYIRELFNILYPVAETDKIKKYMFNYVLSPEEGFDNNVKYLDGLIKNFDSAKFKLSSQRIFKKVLQSIPQDDMYYYHSNRRKVIYKELLFVLVAICSSILKKNKRESILANKYFLNEKALSDFQKNTGRSLNSNKLTHIISVLKKHNLVSVDFTETKGTSIYKIGSGNPLYMFDDIPDVIVKEEKTSHENQLERALSEIDRLNELIENQKDTIFSTNEKIELLQETLQRQVLRKWDISNKPIKRPDTFENDLADLISGKKKDSVPEELSGEELLHNAAERLLGMAG